MKNWNDDDGTRQCSSTEDFMAAAQVCDALGIHLHTANFAQEYREQVFEHFLTEHRNGRTPNPDILCNRFIKFKVFIERANELGADGVATGHYARIRTKQTSADTGKQAHLELLSGIDVDKDQSYFLAGLNETQLKNVLFPVGELSKSEVRRLAKDASLPTHDRPDSTGICFIGERHYQSFLERYLPSKSGPIVDVEGNVLGKHNGTHYYTIGQRRGLGIGGRAQSQELPWYVVEKNHKTNCLVVAQGVNHPALFHRRLCASQINWIGAPPEKFPLRCYAKIRYRSQANSCVVTLSESGHNLEVSFKQPQRAIAPGQSVVFYSDDICLGSAVIDAATN